MSTNPLKIDPILVEIVEGTLASVEQEVETAIGRTSRSPMIRDAHDFRAGIHDRQLRKLTGRSYSALVHPVVRDYPMDTMNPGDVYFHNDVYLSEGGIGHLPDLCVTVPVFFEGEVVCFVQAFGQFQGSLPAKLNDYTIGLLQFNDLPDMFPEHRLEVQLIGHIKIGRNSFGVTIDHNGLKTTFFDGQQAVNAAIIELNALTNSVGATAQNNNFLLLRGD